MNGWPDGFDAELARQARLLMIAGAKARGLITEGEARRLRRAVRTERRVEALERKHRGAPSEGR